MLDVPRGAGQVKSVIARGALPMAGKAVGELAAVQDGAVLHVATHADAHLVDVAADHHAGPDRNAVVQFDIADQRGGGVDVDILASLGTMLR